MWLLAFASACPGAAATSADGTPAPVTPAVVGETLHAYREKVSALIPADDNCFRIDYVSRTKVPPMNLNGQLES